MIGSPPPLHGWPLEILSNSTCTRFSLGHLHTKHGMLIGGQLGLVCGPLSYLKLDGVFVIKRIEGKKGRLPDENNYISTWEREREELWGSKFTMKVSLLGKRRRKNFSTRSMWHGKRGHKWWQLSSSSICHIWVTTHLLSINCRWKPWKKCFKMWKNMCAGIWVTLWIDTMWHFFTPTQWLWGDQTYLELICWVESIKHETAS